MKHPPENNASIVALCAMIGASVTISGGSLKPTKIANAVKPEGSHNVAPMLINVDKMPTIIETSSARLAMR